MTSRFAEPPERRRPRYGLAAGCAALALVAATTSRTARAEVDLQWIAPAECPREEAVREKMRSLAAGSLDQVDRLSAEGEITRVESRYTLRLRVRVGGEVRERVIESEGCAELAGAAAVTLGLLLQSGTAAHEGTGGTAGAPSNTPDGSGTGATGAGGARGNAGPEPPGSSTEDPRSPVAPRAPPQAEDDGGELGFVLRAPVVALDIGPLPVAGFDVGGGVGVGYAAWQLVAAGRFHPSQRIEAGPIDGAGTTVRRLAAELSVCRRFGSKALTLAPCAVIALEHLTAEGFGPYVRPRQKRAAWAAPGAGLLARLSMFDSLALLVGATVYVEVARPRLVIENVGEIDQLAPVALRAFLGTEWLF